MLWNPSLDSFPRVQLSSLSSFLLFLWCTFFHPLFSLARDREVLELDVGAEDFPIPYRLAILRDFGDCSGTFDPFPSLPSLLRGIEVILRSCVLLLSFGAWERTFFSDLHLPLFETPSVRSWARVLNP